MIFVTFPLMICALAPVILVEIWVAKPKLQGIYGKPAWAIAVANLASTIIGVPLAWAVVLGLELLGDKLLGERFLKHASPPVLMITELLLGPAWIGPPDGKHDWIVPAAAMLLLIPTFFASWYIEAIIVNNMVAPEWRIVRRPRSKQISLPMLCCLSAGAVGFSSI